MFNIIKTKEFLYWNKVWDAPDTFNGKELTSIKGKIMIVLVDDSDGTRFIFTMNGLSWEKWRKQILSDDIAIFLFPTLSSMPLN